MVFRILQGLYSCPCPLQTIIDDMSYIMWSQQGDKLSLHIDYYVKSNYNDKLQPLVTLYGILHFQTTTFSSYNLSQWKTTTICSFYRSQMSLPYQTIAFIHKKWNEKWKLKVGPTKSRIKQVALWSYLASPSNNLLFTPTNKLLAPTFQSLFYMSRGVGHQKIEKEKEKE